MGTGSVTPMSFSCDTESGPYRAIKWIKELLSEGVRPGNCSRAATQCLKEAAMSYLGPLRRESNARYEMPSFLRNWRVT